MKTKILAVLLPLMPLTISIAPGQVPAVDIPLTVSDGVNSRTLYFGLDPTATDSIDLPLGESELPPKPPTGVLDARFVEPDTSIHIGNGLSKDYRQGALSIFGTRVHMLSYQVGEGTSITISWNLPAGVVGRLQDLALGTLIDTTMTGSGSYDVANPGSFSSLKMTIDYNVLRASLKVLLEGPFNTGTNLMNTALNTGGTLSTQFPDVAIPGSAVDSITLEIRDSLSAATSTIRKLIPAWLLADGSVRAFQDTTQSYLKFDTLAGDYRLVVWHRNHLPIMTSTALSLTTSTPLPYDFTTSQSQAYGTNPMKLVGTKYCMYAGDGNGSGGINATDRNLVWRPENGLLGYLNGDFNLSGGVNATDRNLFWRPNNGTVTQVP